MSGDVLFSILMPTLVDRRAIRAPLLRELERQVRGQPVEILLDEDSRERTTGRKRNDLLGRARGKFSAFIDDDDWVSDTYVEDVLAVVNAIDIDCVGFWGEARWEDGLIRRMIHSLMCPVWTEWKSDDLGYVYYRHPNHLNPIRTDLARSIRYPDITISEDHIWTRAMAASGKLRKEVFLAGKCFYTYRPHGAVRGL